MDLIGWLESLYYAFHRRGDVIERLRAWSPPGVSLRTLDHGGGSGRVSKGLAESSPGTFVVADIDAFSLRRVPRSASLHAVVVPASGPLPFREAAFDRVLLVDVLHEVNDGRGLLQELARALRPGGAVMIVEFDGGAVLPRVFRRIAALAGHRCRPLVPDELRAWLTASGLSARVEPIDGLRFLAHARAALPLAAHAPEVSEACPR